mgnify:CR=1 FL=1
MRAAISPLTVIRYGALAATAGLGLALGAVGDMAAPPQPRVVAGGEQYGRGVAHHDEAAGEQLLRTLERIKWLLWHEKVHWAFEEATSLYDDVDGLELAYPHLRKLVRAARELLSHIANGRGGLINYGERFRSGERISSAMAESPVDVVVSKRFAKRQQMQ